MSSTLSVYVISFDRLKKVRGSRDRGLVAAIGARLEYFLSQVDELRDEDEDIPTPDDHPSIGSWSPHVIPGALEAIRRADLAGSEDETMETITQIRGWLEAAVGDPEEGLVGLLS
jgi:hypothetical protein